MNYYVKIDNNQYNVIDGNTNRVVATFMSEIDAHKFLQSLYEDMFKRNTFGFQQNYGPMPIPTINPYPVVNPYFGQPFMGQGQYINQPNLYQQPQNFNNSQFDPNLQANTSINPNLMNQSQQSQDNKNLKDETKDNNIDLIKFSPRDIAEFNDNNLTIDPLIFLEDKKGAIIKKDKKKEINNGDDNSLGEVAIYKENQLLSDQLPNSKEIKPDFDLKENNNIDKNQFINKNIKANQEFTMNNQSEDKGQAIIKKNLESNQTQNINQIYAENKVEEFKVSDPNVIDLGPIEEDDTIFSTPRNDAKEGEPEFYTLSKKEKKELKILQKREAANKKRYEKMLS